MTEPPSMRFFIDECVPVSVAETLEKEGFEVIRLQEKTLPGSSDNLVAAVAEANNAILVTMDADFKTITSRIQIGRARFRRLSLLRFERCRESEAAQRLTKALS